MAKSARASVIKRNHRNLRKTVFGPAHDARTARLSAKLQELASKPGPEKEKEMEVEPAAETSAGGDSSKTSSEAMELDAMGVTINPAKSAALKKQVRKELKVSKRKPRNQMVFPSETARRKRLGKSKATR